MYRIHGISSSDCGEAKVGHESIETSPGNGLVAVGCLSSIFGPQSRENLGCLATFFLFTFSFSLSFGGPAPRQWPFYGRVCCEAWWRNTVAPSPTRQQTASRHESTSGGCDAKMNLSSSCCAQIEVSLCPFPPTGHTTALVRSFLFVAQPPRVTPVLMVRKRC
ncbi:hypothetical protein BDW62DRAFT_176246 [Aspergillus aurantiobrunneus]